MNICIFEDKKFSNFFPIALSRPVWQLKCGIFSLSEKINFLFPNAKYYYHTRKYLHLKLKQDKLKLTPKFKLSETCLFINGRILADAKFIKKVTSTKQDTLYYQKNELVAAFLSGDNLKSIEVKDDEIIFPDKEIKKEKIEVQLVEYIWDLVNLNSEQIEKDAKLKFELGEIKGKIYDNVTLIKEENIFIGSKCKIKPSVVIDAEEGPVVIDDDTEIMSNSTIVGPVYIGKKCKVKCGAKIYEGTSIGQVCKVGGEIEETIIHEYSNKQHDGFLGHAYIGSWCNLGADTNNSDLKNNYGSVDVILDGENKTDTGLTFVGLFMGDHSKTGIDTMFNTGTVVGFCSNVFGAGYLPKYISSFSWLEAKEENQIYKLEKAVDVAKKVMQRRDIRFSNSDKTIFNYLFKAIK
jgi:UDP-N-acetylglucosamine diphosphorylase / glucose-1-phosphate thymidylyltransferase / UDP-N-acetylgalactosamine diphosphorylase / glucosamine-1-phosphate N-acetyltransferase / galactosamine-1-phosphate N-acetyltransferase